MEEVSEEVALNLAMAQTEELFRDRVRSEFINLINTDATIRNEIDRRVERKMRAFKGALVEAIPRAIDACMYPEEKAEHYVLEKQKQLAKEMMEHYKNEVKSDLGIYK